MADRTTPYGAFNFLVNLNRGVGPDSPLGGFSDVSGLGFEITMAEYRNGNEKENHVRKVVGMHKVPDVTLKRGIVNSSDLWEWVKDTQRKGANDPKTNVSITLRDEEGNAVQTWELLGVVPTKLTGPTLAAKGGGDVAMEEIVLSAEGMNLEVA